MNKLIITIILALAIAVTIPSVYAVVDGTLFGIEGGCCVTPPPRIHQINKTDTGIDGGQTIGGLAGRLDLNVNITGSTITGINGMSVDPTTGIFYGIARHTASGTDRHLISFDPLTGIGSDIGGMGDKFQTLAFKSDGSLRAITGSISGTPNPYQLHSVDKTTGITTFLCQFPTPTGSFQEAGQLAFNFQDGFMYHLQGDINIPTAENNTKLGKIISESNSPTFCGEIRNGLPNANGFFSTVLDFAPRSFAYSIEENVFYGTSLGSKGFWKMTLSGVTTEIRQPSIAGYNRAFTLNPPQGNEIKGLAFDLAMVPDSVDPVITTLVAEPIPIQQNSVFDEFEFMSCIDDTNGDITNTMATVGSVDTSTPRTYFVNYTCTDVALNESQLQVQYIVKRPPTSGGGITITTTTSGAGEAGGVTTVPSGIPPLSFVPSEPTEPPRRTLQDIFDLFASLFEEAEPTPTLEFVPEPESITDIPAPLFEPTVEPTEVRPSFIESIQNFFARLFG